MLPPHTHPSDAPTFRLLPYLFCVAEDMQGWFSCELGKLCPE